MICPTHNNLAKQISRNQKIPVPDALHAVIAKSYNAVLVSQDNHFLKLSDFVKVKKPEEI